jgi:hypothetical protein
VREINMRIIAIGLIISVMTLSAGDVLAQTQDLEAVAWRQVAEAIPLGSKIKIQTHDSRRINGTLMRADGAAVMVKRNTRRPEPAVTVPFDDIAKLERDHGGRGMNIGKAIAVGAATGAGVIAMIFVIALGLE